MADTGIGGGYTLADLLSGAAGNMPNRPLLNYQVATGQALNGLRSAQTEDALDNARKAQNEATMQQQQIDARNNLSQNFQKNGYNPALADELAGEQIAFGTNMDEVMRGRLAEQTAQQKEQIQNPNTSPDQRALTMEAMTGKPVDVATNVPGNYSIAPGLPQPNVQQTPQAAASTALTENEATHPNLYHPPPAGSTPQSPQDVATRAHLIATGAAQFPTPYEWARNATNAGAVTRAALAENPTLSQSLFPQVQSTIKDFSGEGKNGQRLIGYGTVENHLDLAQQAIAALGNGTFTPANAVYQSVSRTFGGAAPTNMQLLGPYIGAEVYRALSGSQIGTGEERTQVQSAFSAARSPDQLNQAVALTRSVLSGGENQLRNAYESGVRGLAGAVPWVPTFDQIKNGQVSSGILSGQPPGAQGGGAPQGGAPAAAAPTQSGAGQTIRVRAPDGRTGTIPAANLQQAIAAGYQRVQ